MHSEQSGCRVHCLKMFSFADSRRQAVFFGPNTQQITGQGEQKKGQRAVFF